MKRVFVLRLRLLWTLDQAWFRTSKRDAELALAALLEGLAPH